MGGGKAMKYWRMIWIKSNIWQKFRHLPKVFWTIIFFRLGAKIFFNYLKASNIELWVVLEFYEGVFGFLLSRVFVYCLRSIKVWPTRRRNTTVSSVLDLERYCLTFGLVSLFWGELQENEFDSHKLLPSFKFPVWVSVELLRLIMTSINF